MRLVVCCVCGAGGCRLIRVTAGGISNVVDLYNSASGAWSTAQLGIARSQLAATSVGNVAIFAGGRSNCFFALFVVGLMFWLMSVGDAVTFACLRRVACCLLCLRCRRLPSHEGHCRYLFKLFCGRHVQQCIGHMVDCAAQCGALDSCSDICWERGHLRGGLRER